MLETDYPFYPFFQTPPQPNPRKGQVHRFNIDWECFLY